MVPQARANSMPANFPVLDVHIEKAGGEGPGKDIKKSSEAELGLPKPSCHASVFLSFVSDRVCNRPDDINLMGRGWNTKRLIEVASLCKQMNFNIAYLTTSRASCRCATKGSFIIVIIMPANSSSYKMKMSFQPAG